MSGIFGLYNYSKPGKGVSKNEPKKKGMFLYFDIFFRKIWNLIILNFIYILFSLPAIFINYCVLMYCISLCATLTGLDIAVNATSFNIISIVFALILLLIIGSGPATAAVSYIIRQYVNGAHVWVWSDYIDSFKKNFKQGLMMYLINTVVCIVLILYFILCTYISELILFDILKGVILIIALMFVIMQLYTYNLLSGFKLSVKNIYKNALYLTTAKLPWNAFVILLIGVILGVAIIPIFSFPAMSIIIFGLILFSLVVFTALFMTNNIVNKYVLEPELELSEFESISEVNITEK